jgi:hypothetical protein
MTESRPGRRSGCLATSLAALILLAAAGCVRSSAPVTFVLKNSHSEELAFNMDRGWQPNLFAYRGKPPRAKWILMFPKHCAASCDVSARRRCPVCKEPETARGQLAAQKFERIAPGDDIEIQWDGRAFHYEKTRGTRGGKRRRCECHRTEPAEPGTYTVKACGLRLTRSAEKRSRLQCVEAEMTLPASGTRVELDFGAPGRGNQAVSRRTATSMPDLACAAAPR